VATSAQKQRTPANQRWSRSLSSGLYRRLRNQTGSADLGFRQALAGLGIAALTAGGELHPAL